MFRYKFWHLAVVSWVGILSIAYGVHWISSGQVSAAWIFGVVFAYFFWATCTTVGYHRLFAHQAFTCSPFWHYLFAVGGALFWNGSVMQWVAAHTTHHQFHDTDRDPHYTGWAYLLWKYYHKVPVDIWSVRKYMRSSFHMFIHNYYVLLVFAFIALLYLLSPKILVFMYLIPLGLFRLIGGLHTIITHLGDGKTKYPVDYPWLEFILPMMGEWNHGRHHERPGDWNLRYKKWHIDPGALVIKAISK